MNDSRAAIKQGFKKVSLTVARKEDFGSNDRSYCISCHLGDRINYNDTVLAYDLEQTNCVELDYMKERKGSFSSQMPEIVVVKKCYPKNRKKTKKRNWKIKFLEM